MTPPNQVLQRRAGAFPFCRSWVTNVMLYFDAATVYEDSVMKVTPSNTALERTTVPLPQRALRDEDFVRLAGEKLVAGWSQRRVAREFGVPQQTVTALVRLLESRGELQPLKKRMSERLGSVLDQMVEDLGEEIEAGRKFNAIEYGILFDKWSLLNGEATAKIEYVGPSLDALKRELAEIIDVDHHVVAEGQSGTSSPAG
jgi:DNA-binding transcriptional regulator LsrR (DeoR family)